MEMTENQTPINYRDQLMGRMKTRYPDRNYEGTEGTEGTDDLYQSIVELLDEYEGKNNEYEQNNERLVGLFNSSPAAARFLKTWVNTQSPAAAFREVLGKEAFEAMQSEEGAKVLAKIEEDEAKKKAEDEAYEQERQNNLQQSFAALDEFGNEKGLDDDGKVDLFMSVWNMAADAVDGKYSRELFEAAWKARHYQEDVDNARHEGEVTGRNAKIREQQRRRQDVGSMPPALSGQGASVPEQAPVRRKQWSDFLK